MKHTNWLSVAEKMKNYRHDIDYQFQHWCDFAVRLEKMLSLDPAYLVYQNVRAEWDQKSTTINWRHQSVAEWMTSICRWTKIMTIDLLFYYLKFFWGVIVWIKSLNLLENKNKSEMSSNGNTFLWELKR